MSMTKVPRMNLDLLIAVFAIYDVLNRYQDSNGREISIAENEDGSIYSEPESDVEMNRGPASLMLWRDLSCMTEFEKIYENSQLPIQVLLHILRNANFDVDCFINISEYEKLLSIDHIQESLQDGHLELQKIFSSVKEKQMYRGPLSETLMIFLDSLFHERRRIQQWENQMIEERGIDPQEYFLKSNFIEILFLDQKQKSLSFFTNFLEEYLLNFKNNNIDCNQINIWKWEKQRKVMIDYLQNMHNDFGNDVWIWGKDKTFSPEERPIETLIAMAFDKEIIIKDISRHKNNWNYMTWNLNIEPLFKGIAKTEDQQREFEFAGTLTDFQIGRIHKQENKTLGKGLNKSKRRYLWEFLSTIHGNEKGQTRDAVDKFVSDKLGRTEKVTNKDFEGLAEIVASYSTHPKEQVTKCFVYKEKVFLKKIG